MGVCFGLFTGLELVLDRAVGWFFPLYGWIKAAIYAFFFIPQKNGKIGATIVMARVVPLIEGAIGPLEAALSPVVKTTVEGIKAAASDLTSGAESSPKNK